ncbi:MAG: DUF3387 domain-containing protein, partial [Bdellovibrionaceae bacterium]|nr:DUF3387 domain-containing protein [Pseudobdellovibrionaceae bacterium]
TSCSHARHRVTPFKIQSVEKRNGEIIDYYGVFRNMKKALKNYAQGSGEEPPVQDKAHLFVLLEEAIAQAVGFCEDKSIFIGKLLENRDVFKTLGDFEQFADTLLGNDEWRKGFNVHENTISSLYEACKPEVLGNPVVRKVAVFQYLRGVMDAIIGRQDLEDVSRKIAQLLDASVVTDASHQAHVMELPNQSVFRIVQRGRVWDFSKIDFDQLQKDFKQAHHQKIHIADLRAFLEMKMEDMLKVNITRKDFALRLQGIIDRYNTGGSSNENYFDQLVKFTKDLGEEEERHVREGLTKDELEIYDLLKKEKMTRAEQDKVKLAARSLLNRLIKGKPRVLVQDWFKDSQSRKQVRSTVEEVLHDQLPESYDRAIFTEKCNRIFDLMIDYASQGLKWAA